MKVQALDKNKHDRNSFDCGKPALNKYLQQTARQHNDIDLSRTFVLTDTETENAILGFYTLTLCNIQWEELPDPMKKKYPSTGVSAALIGRLAIDKNEQKKGLGGTLLLDAIKRVLGSGESLPFPAIIVDAKDDDAKKFYEAYDFEEIHPGSNRLYIPSKHAKNMIEEAGI